MYPLETRIQSWREEMSAAGIGPGPVRDELESHLRETVEELVRSGESEPKAFAMAMARLGSGAQLRSECDAAISPVKRIWRAVVFFPTNLCFAAWCALGLGAYLSLTILRLTIEIAGSYPQRVLTTSQVIVISLITLLIGWLAAYVIRASLSYLRKPSFPMARALAVSWTVTFWMFGTSAGSSVFGPASSIQPYPALWTVLFSAACFIVARFVYEHWKRHLVLAEGAQPPAPWEIHE